jgi:hypothetical protein
MLIPRFDEFKIASLCAAMFISALCPRIACATLGEPEGSVQTDVTELRATIKASNDFANYRVHEIQLPSGTVLREFVASGNVFAVVWKGPAPPDFRQTLGKYFDRLVSAPPQSHLDRNHLQLEQPDLVVQSHGHMHAFSGRAYLPAAIPNGVNLGDLH